MPINYSPTQLEIPLPCSNSNKDTCQNGSPNTKIFNKSPTISGKINFSPIDKEKMNSSNVTLDYYYRSNQSSPITNFRYSSCQSSNVKKIWNDDCPIVVKQLSEILLTNKAEDVQDSEANSSSPDTNNYISTPKLLKSYGVRNFDEEYNDFSDLVSLRLESPVNAYVRSILDEKSKLNEQLWNSVSSITVNAFEALEEAINLQCQQQCQEAKNIYQKKLNLLKNKWEAHGKEVFMNLDKESKLQKKELDRKEAEFSKAKNLELQNKKYQEEQDKLRKEKETLHKKIELEEAAENDRLPNAEISEKTKEAEVKQEIEAKESTLKHQEQISSVSELTKPSENPQDLMKTVPPQFTNCILVSDLEKYLKSQVLLQGIDGKTQHITNRSKFYFEALKLINNPLNQVNIRNLQLNTDKLVNIISGRTIQTSVSTNFSVSQENDGDLFVLNLLGYRFVKKSEADSSENKMKRENLNFLAKLGVSLIKTFPLLGNIIEAHFYKVCPFLVPFSFPRKGMDILEYAEALGHSVNTDGNTAASTLTQVLLDRISGYCMLYAFMVQTMTTCQIKTSEDSSSQMEFFTLQGVWKILAKTMSLEPQEEVTAAVIQSLLEILNELLLELYGNQFVKLLKYLKEIYLHRIRKITSEGKSASITRLEIFLDKFSI